MKDYCTVWSKEDTSRSRHKEENLGETSGADGDTRNDTSKNKETYKKL